jgi:hypothetical protein
LVNAARPDVPPGKTPPVDTFDYRDFGSGETTQRVFAVTNGGAVTQIVDDITQDPESGQTIVERSYWSGATRVQVYVYTFVATDTDLSWVTEVAYDGEGTLLSSTEFQPPLSMQQSVMPRGSVQANAAARIRTTDDPSETTVAGVTRWDVALGLEDVSVPYAELTGCLKMFEHHNSSQRIVWYCPDIGTVKRIQGDNGPIWALTGCTGCCPQQ